MERRGGCCIAKYGGGGGDYRADGACKVGRIMLRFRPIAPKPAAAAAAAVAPVAASTEARTFGRARRKAGGGGGGGREGRRGRKARKILTGVSKEETGTFQEEKEKRSPSLSSELSRASAAGSGTMVTLSLMPETPERKEAPPPAEVPAVPYVIPAWLRARPEGAGGGGEGEVVTPRPMRPAGSWVTVECVTDTWREGEVGAAAAGDHAVRAALDADEACPGFISDAWDRVTWTNAAYRRMVVGPAAGDGKATAAEEEEEDVRVALVTRGMVPGATCRAFTCHVRVRYASRRRGRGSLAAPCDVWRMDDGGCLWRLDVKAALSLSLGR